MATFFVVGADQTSEALAPGETGVVAETGILFTNGVAISTDGQVELIVLGDVIAANSTAVTMSVTSDANFSVGADGSIQSSDASAISGTYRNSLSIQNAGVIAGDENGVVLNMASDATAGTVLISNSGWIRAAGSASLGGVAVFHAGQSDTANRFVLINTGSITHGSGTALSASNSAADITNTGTMIGMVFLDGTEADRLSNGGLIVGAITFGAQNDTLTNTGQIEGAIDMGLGADSLTNYGTILGGVQMGMMSGSVEGSSDAADSVVNTGIIHGDIILSGGSDVFRNQGGQVLGVIYGGYGADTFHVDRSDLDIRDSTDGSTSSGDAVFSTASFTLRAGIENLTLVGPAGLVGHGNVLANTLTGGDGADTLVGAAGGDVLNGGAGDDALYGGRGADLLNGGDGDDALSGGRDDDQLGSSDGSDTLSGGAGNDAFLVGSDGGSLLGGTGFDMASFLIGGVSISANLNTGVVVDTLGTRWTIQSVERLTLALGDDTVVGSQVDNLIDGSAGNDHLGGGKGADTLIGGEGADTLEGGTGADLFSFTSVSESGPLAPDVITDFALNGDQIDLTAIDAIPGGGNDAFAFVGQAAFSGIGPQVRFTRDTVAGTTMVEIRLGGSVVTDMTIQLDSALILAVDDFVL